MAFDINKYKINTNAQPQAQSGGFDISKYKTQTPGTGSPTANAVLTPDQPWYNRNITNPEAHASVSDSAPVLSQFGYGAAKAGLGTLRSIGQFGGSVANFFMGKGFTPDAPGGLQYSGMGKDIVNADLSAKNPGEMAGALTEKAGEFLAPGSVVTKGAKATETALSGIKYGSQLLDKVIPFIGKQAVKSVGMGVVGGVESGDVKTGVLTGALEALSPVGAKIAESLFKNVAGFMSSTGSKVLERAISNPDKIEKAVTEYAQNPEQKAELVDKARSALLKFNKAKTDEYGGMMDKLQPSQKFMGTSGAQDKFKEKIGQFGGTIDNKGELTFQNTTLTPTDQKTLQSAHQIIQGWTDKTVRGIDNLKQALGNLMDEAKVAGGNPRSAVVLSETIGDIKSYLKNSVPGYDKVLKTYAEKSTAAKQLAQELSQNGQAKPSTQLKQIMNLFNKDASVMKNLIKVMGKKGAEDFLNEVSGAMLSEWLPASKVGTAIRGLGEIGAGAGALAAGAGSIPTAAAGAMGLASMSPRIVGAAATQAGKIAPALPTVRRAITGGIIGQPK